jgi:alkaline phosphatase
MTQKAIETLSQNPEGFFLMVEEEGINEMAHQSNAGLLIKAGRQLDEAVTVGQSFAESDDDTLVIVAADHETSSLAIEDTHEIQSDPEHPNESGEGRTAEDGPFRVANSDKKFLVELDHDQPHGRRRAGDGHGTRRAEPGRHLREHPHTRCDIGGTLLRFLLGLRLC